MKLGKWAGWTTLAFGSIHLLGGTIASAQYIPGWFTGDTWNFKLEILSQSQSHWWLAPGSFGVPMIVLGALVVWLAKRDIKPPQFVGWTILAWAAFATWTLEPSGAPLCFVPAVLLILAARKQVQSPSIVRQ